MGQPTFRLSSFKRWHERSRQRGRAYSVAVYQPRWYPVLETAPCFNILDSAGNWIRPRDFIPEDHDARKPSRAVLNRYFAALVALYESRESEIEQWLEAQEDDDVTLLCWCPYDRAAKRQLQQFDSFVCHTAAVGYYLGQRGLRVIPDKDRGRMMWPRGERISTAHTHGRATR